LNEDRPTSKRRIHHDYVVALSAEVDESEAMCGIVGEKAALKSTAVLGLLGVGFECIVNSLFGPFPELFIVQPA
jgi:hypothetical protein